MSCRGKYSCFLFCYRHAPRFATVCYLIQVLLRSPRSTTTQKVDHFRCGCRGNFFDSLKICPGNHGELRLSIPFPYVVPRSPCFVHSVRKRDCRGRWRHSVNVALAIFWAQILLNSDSRGTLFRHTHISFQAKVFCFSLGFTTAFGSLFSKTWRVYKIFTNKKLLKMVRFSYLKVMPSELFCICCKTSK